MEYFILRQDRNLTGAIKPLNLSWLKKIHDFEDITVVAVDKQSHEQYVDFLDSPRAIASDKLKRILSAYNSQIIFKILMLVDVKSIYWLFEAPEIDCLSPNTELQKKDKITRLVLDREKVKEHAVFSVKGIPEHYIIINLNVAEKIFQQDPWGIILQEVEAI
ncbi:hypothetical protein [Anaerosinus massiliensis]|uniref:hypothetical protein n=1 Tax=Massilibacillus massiliensis TaxID=1806837 RepID=UPI000DA5F8C3|nr:hypothetical protein [Massilibacillus massiliensis]